ncbi:MFS transporter [Bauldia sp.]|uniref:MFS transporter n=1 Tax=Bauldia sp. TaxID=2575872 RepID=UPI003BAB0B12
MQQPIPTARTIVRETATWYGYLATGCFSYLLNIQGNILPFLKVELDLTYQAVSLHSTAIAIGWAVIGVAGERLVRAFGRQRLMMAGMLGTATAAVLFTFATQTWESLGASLVFGFFGGLVVSMVPAFLSDLHGPNREIVFAEYNAVAFAFAVMAPALTGLVIWLGLGWRLAVFAGAAISLAVLLRFARAQLPPIRTPSHQEGSRLPLAFWFFWLTIGLSVAVEFSVMLWAPAYLQRVVGLPESTAAAGNAAFLASMLVCRIAGILLLRRFTTRQLFLASAATTVVGFLIYWSAPGVWIAIGGLAVLGLGVALLFPLGLSFAVVAAGTNADRATARVALAAALAIMLTPPLIGGVADAVGLHGALLATPLFMVLAVMAFIAGSMIDRRSNPAEASS